MKLAKKIILIIASIVGVLVLLVLGTFLFLTIVEYRPSPVEKLEISNDLNRHLERNTPCSIVTWNIGYAGLGKNEDFFMDGGKMVQPESKAVVQQYFDGIKQTIDDNPSDILFIQEIDIKAKRTRNINQFEELKSFTGKNAVFGMNYKCAFVPFPFPPMGHIESGIAIYTKYEVSEAERRALPVPFKWPVRVANIKRCILAERIPVYENGQKTGKELVLADFHLEAFDNGEGKIAQTKALMDFLNSEYAKGNYIIAGGDFNQKFPGSTAFPAVWLDGWLPGQLDASMLDEGWEFAFDDSKPTCRSVEFPYVGEKADNRDWQYHVIDGFIVSPNVHKKQVRVIDEGFKNSDHNPVYMNFILE